MSKVAEWEDAVAQLVADIQKIRDQAKGFEMRLRDTDDLNVAAELTSKLGAAATVIANKDVKLTSAKESLAAAQAAENAERVKGILADAEGVALRIDGALVDLTTLIDQWVDLQRQAAGLRGRPAYSVGDYSELQAGIQATTTRRTAYLSVANGAS